EQRPQALGGADAEVVRTLRADVQAFFEVLLVDELRATGAFDPQPLGHPAWFFGGGGCNRLAGLLEPRHQGVLRQVTSEKSKVTSRYGPRTKHQRPGTEVRPA